LISIVSATWNDNTFSMECFLVQAVKPADKGREYKTQGNLCDKDVRRQLLNNPFVLKNLQVVSMVFYVCW